MSSAYKFVRTAVTGKKGDYATILDKLTSIYNSGPRRDEVGGAQLREAELALYNAIGIPTENRNLSQISEEEVNKQSLKLGDKDLIKYMYLKEIINGLNSLMKDDYSKVVNIERTKKGLNEITKHTSETSRGAKLQLGKIIHKMRQLLNAGSKASAIVNFPKIPTNTSFLQLKKMAEPPQFPPMPMPPQPAKKSKEYYEVIELYGLQPYLNQGMTEEELIIILGGIAEKEQKFKNYLKTDAELRSEGKRKDLTYIKGHIQGEFDPMISPRLAKLREDAVVAYLISQSPEMKKKIIANLYKAEVNLMEQARKAYFNSMQSASAASTSTSTSTGRSRNTGAGVGLGGGKRKTRKVQRKNRKTRRN